MRTNLVTKFILIFVIFSNGHRLNVQSPIEGATEEDLKSTKLLKKPRILIPGLCRITDYPDICIELGEKSYLIEAKETKNWHDAERFCREQNGYLANIENAKEMDLIVNYLKSKKYEGYYDSSFYIGGNDIDQEGIYYSVGTGELMPYQKWLPGEPNNGSGQEDCVHLWNVDGIYAMNDERCTNLDHYICELKY